VRDLGAFAGQGFVLFEAMPAAAVAGVLAGPPLSLGPAAPEPEPAPHGVEQLSGPDGRVASLIEAELVELVDLTALPDLPEPIDLT